MTTATWQGVNRAGRWLCGAMAPTDTYADFVQRKYRAGWRSLVVSFDRIEVGAIARHPDTGRRTWWGLDARERAS